MKKTEGYNTKEMDLLYYAKNKNYTEMNKIISKYLNDLNKPKVNIKKIDNQYQPLSKDVLNKALKEIKFGKVDSNYAALNLIKAGANPDIFLTYLVKNANPKKHIATSDIVDINNNLDALLNNNIKVSQESLNKALRITNKTKNWDVAQKLIEAGANPQIFYDFTKGNKISDSIHKTNEEIILSRNNHAETLSNNIRNDITNNSDNSKIVEDIIKLSLYNQDKSLSFLQELISKNPQAEIIISEDMKTILNDLPVNYSTLLLYELSKITSKEVMDEAFSKNSAWKKISNFNNKIEQEIINLVKKHEAWSLEKEEILPSEITEASAEKMVQYAKESKLDIGTSDTIQEKLSEIINDTALKQEIRDKYSKTPSWVEKFIQSVEEAIKSIFVKQVKVSHAHESPIKQAVRTISTKPSLETENININNPKPDASISNQIDNNRGPLK